MKLSYSVSFQHTSHNLFAQGNFQNQINLLSQIGYHGTEIGVKSPHDIRDNIDLGKLLDDLRMEISAVGTGQAYMDEHLSLSSRDKTTRRAAVDRLVDCIDFAKQFRSKVIIGLIRGNSRSRPSYKNFYESMKPVCDYAQKKSVTILLEPLNRYETGLLNTAAETIEFIDRMKCPQLKLLLDVFHMNIEESDFYDTIIKSRKYLDHIHLADNNRRCPGEGMIDFKKIVSSLRKIGYDKYLTCEILSDVEFETSARSYFQFMNGILQKS